MYDNHTKETWRGWAWNQAHMRIQKQKVKNPTAICLAGSIAGDLKHAKARKINLIAVDYDNNCVNEFRKQGGIAIEDTLRNQVLSIQPNIVIADFLGGLTTIRAKECIWFCSVTNVVIFNFLRGRDQDVTTFKNKLIDAGLNENEDAIKIKHRGELFFRRIMFGLIGMNLERNNISDEDQRVLVALKNFEKLCKPKFYTYQSKDSNQYFDSVAINTALLRNPQYSKTIKELMPKKSRQLSSAAKALTTRQINKI